MALSVEQLAIANFVATTNQNLVVRARAGTGKSFTIRKIIPLFGAKVAVLAFGKDAAADMSAKCAEEGIHNAQVGTFHSFGLRAVFGAYKNTKVISTTKKFEQIVERLCIPKYLESFVSKAMSLAMQRGFGVFHKINSKSEWFAMIDHFNLEDCLGEDNMGVQVKGMEQTVMDGIVFAIKAIKLSLEMLPVAVSFDDMMYAPLALNLNFPRFDAVLVDEFQDSNPCRREIAARMMKTNGRFVGVGDDMQAIMGFTGADNDAMDQGIAQFNATVFPLTVTRRCSQAVVKLAQTLVPDFAAHEDNQEGNVDSITQDEFTRLALIPGEDAVICRKTAPLISVCYSLLARSISARVLGKDIGAGLIKLVDRWKVKSLQAFEDKLSIYYDKEVEKLTNAKKTTAVEALTDKVEALRVMINALPRNTATLADLRSQIEMLFVDASDGTKKEFVTLMTAHKSKGLEFNRVFGLGNAKWFPSKYAEQAWQLHQEDCLLYVLWTRAIQTYVDVVVD